MEEPMPKPSTEGDAPLFDALDEFPSHDSPSNVESQEATASQLEDEPPKPEQSLEAPSPAGLRRRLSFSQHGRDPKDSSLEAESAVSSEVGRINGMVIKPGDRRHKIYRKSMENEKACEESDPTPVRFTPGRSLTEQNDEKSSIASVNKVQVDDSVLVDSPGELDWYSSSILVFVAGLVIKAIGFQFDLLVGLFKFPVLSLYYTCAFIMDPFQTIRRGRERGRRYLVGKLMSIRAVFFKSLSPFIHRWYDEHKSLWKLTSRFFWGLMWSAYVCIILVGLLVLSFVLSGLIMRFFVKEPLQMKETLNFDYTKNSPVAFVPVTSCPSVSCGVDCTEKIEAGKSGGLQVIPRNQKFQVAVSLTLPESDYNRNLGIFQVRVDCLSAHGIVLATARHPCMLPFKSKPIRLLLTYFKIVPLLAGYISESQTLNIKLRDFTEGDVPTACLKVMVEQRAEYRPGAGIPEIYAASLFLESDLPLLKSFLWRWKRTIFIWIGMILFFMELMFALVCCTQILIPRPKPRGASFGSSASQGRVPPGGEVGQGLP